MAAHMLHAMLHVHHSFDAYDLQEKKCGGPVINCKYAWSEWKFIGDKDCPTQKSRSLKITKQANACGKQCPKIKDETVDVTSPKINCEGRS